MILALLACAQPCGRGEMRFDLDTEDGSETLYGGWNTVLVHYGGRKIGAGHLVLLTPAGIELASSHLDLPPSCDEQDLWVQEVALELEAPATEGCTPVDVVLNFTDDRRQIDLSGIADPGLNLTMEQWQLCP